MIGRRLFLGGSMAMIGGLPPPRPDQQYRPPAPPGPVGGAAGSFRRIIVVGPAGITGVFTFSPSVGPGNLITSDAPVAGTIAGNAYQVGVTSYDNLGTGQFLAISLQGGALQAFETNSGPGGPYVPVTTLAAGLISFASQTGAFWQANRSLAIGPNQLGNLFFLAPSGSAATDTANLAAILAGGTTPWLLPGTFSINCSDPTLTALGPGQYIYASGDLNTIINAQGSGDLFRWVHTGPISDGTTTGGGLIGGATIDGTACTGAAVGIHAGDINALRFDCRCQHFTRTGGSWGFLFDNANQFTERLDLKIRTKDCGFAGGDGGHVGFTVTSPGGLLTSTGSFSRVRGGIDFTAGSNQQDFLVLNNGAHIYDHRLGLTGNHQGNAVNATTAAAIRIIGTVPAGHPGAGSRSQISNGRLDVGIECSSAANSPTTVVQGTSSNSVRDCYGNVNWNNNFTPSGITGAGWKYDGQVQGDTSLGTRRYYGTAPVQNITANGQTIQAIVPSAKIPVTCAANFTGLVLSPGDADGQLIYLIGIGTGGLTFAAAGVSNVAKGITAQLQPGDLLECMWDAGTALWYVK